MTLWVEDYRPNTINECTLPERLKQTIQEIINSEDVPNLLFSGMQGLGKTTAARAIVNELDADMLFINASDESGIDTLRNKIKQFASTVSMYDSQKIVVLDEADYLNANSTQPALRAFIEEYSNNCRFILTCNFKNKIITPLQSRLSNVDFHFSNDEKPKLMAEFHKRALNILDENDITYDKRTLAQFINELFPDFRKILNELQKYSKYNKEIDVGLLESSGDMNVKELVGLLKEKEFTKMRNWVAAQYSSMDGYKLYSRLYKYAYDIVQKEYIPNFVLLLNQGQLEYTQAVDKEISIVATLTTIMFEIEFL